MFLTGFGLIALLSLLLSQSDIDACIDWTALAQARVSKLSSDLYGDPLPDGAIARLGSTRLRQADLIRTVLFSSDGKILFTAGDFQSMNQGIPCWDAATGKLLRRLPSQEHGARSLASADGKILACVSEGRESIWIIDGETGKVIRRIKSGGLNFLAAAFSPDGKTLASCGAGGVRFWDVSSGKLQRRFPTWDAVWGVSFSPDGKLLAGDGVDCAFVGDIATGKQLWEIRLKLDYGTWGILVFAPDGSVVSGKGVDGAIRFLDARTGKELRRFAGNKGDSVMGFSPDSKLLAVAEHGGDKNGSFIKILDPTTGRMVRRLEGHVRGAYCSAWAPDSKSLAVACGDRTMRLWNPADGKELVPLTRHRAFVSSIAFAPDGKMLAAADYGGDFFLWDARSGKRIGVFEGHKEPINSIAYTPDGAKLLSASCGNRIHIWDAATAKQVGSLKGHKDQVASVIVSPDGRMAATASVDKTIRLWRLATCEEFCRIEDSAVRALAFSPDSRLLVSARSYGVIKLNEAQTGKEVAQFLRHKGELTSIAISADGLLLASAGEGGIRVWEIASRKLVRELTGHKCRVTSVAFAPDGRTLASGDECTTVRLWEIVSGQEIRHFQGHLEEVYTVAFAPDGRSFASGSRDSTILIWDATLGGAAEVGAAAVEASIECIWDQLKETKAATAHLALWRLVRSPTVSVPFLKQKLQAVPPVPKNRLAALVVDLSAERFATRMEAQRELERLQELAVPALREALKGTPSLEFSRRAKRILARIDTPMPPPDRLRIIRAVAALEQINDLPARDLLKSLAAGAKDAHITQEAEAALQRAMMDDRRDRRER